MFPQRYGQRTEFNTPDNAAAQDHMCEPWVIYGGRHNGRTYTGTRPLIDPDHRMSFDELVGVHQRLTVANYLECVRWWPEFSGEQCPLMPTLQGWTIPQYQRCTQMYEDAGIHLPDYPVVGLGSVCTRQGTAEITALAELLTPRLALHGFGVKTTGLLASNRFTSADSSAWSYDARHAAPLPDHEHRHRHCGNCLDAARRWRAHLLAQLAQAGTGTWQDCLPLTWETAA